MSVSIPALLLAALLPVAPADDAPQCRAELQGSRLTTRLAFPDGYAVEAPWQVLSTEQSTLEDDTGLLVLAASLDRIVEEDAITGQRTTTSLQRPITLTFEAPSEPELVHVAARTWCQTVLRARPEGARSHGSALPPPGRIA